MKKKLLILVGIMVILISSVLSYFAFAHKSKSPKELQQEKYWSDVNRDVEKVNKQLREKGISSKNIINELLSLKYDLSKFKNTNDTDYSDNKNSSYEMGPVECNNKSSGRYWVVENFPEKMECKSITIKTTNTTGESNDTISLDIFEFSSVESTKKFLSYVRDSQPYYDAKDIRNRILMTREVSKYVLLMNLGSGTGHCDFENNTCPYVKSAIGSDERTSENRKYIYDVFSRLKLN